MSLHQTLVRLVLSAVGSAAAYRLLTNGGPAVTRPWVRANHAGREVTLLEGPAYAAGAALAAVGHPAALVTVVGTSAVGALDDLRGGAQAKGLRGHLAAARRGEITTGLVKIGGLAATGMVAAALVPTRLGQAASETASRRPALGLKRVSMVVLDGALIAGSANLANLLDLRPGRALKAAILTGGPLLVPGTRAPAAAAVAVGAAIGVLRPDLRGEAMLGDTGANAAGALVGLAVVERLGPLGRLAVLGGVVALTLASERVSFTAVIERTPILRGLDAWGRPTPPPASTA